MKVQFSPGALVAAALVVASSGCGSETTVVGTSSAPAPWLAWAGDRLVVQRPGGAAFEVEGGSFLSWAPRGGAFAYRAEGGNDAIGIGFVTEQRLTRTELVEGPRSPENHVWSPDGRHLAVGGWDGFHVITLAEGAMTARLIHEDVTTDGFEVAVPMVWSDDGRYLAFAAGYPSIQVFVADEEEGFLPQPVEVPEGFDGWYLQAGSGCEWGPGSHRLVFAGSWEDGRGASLLVTDAGAPATIFGPNDPTIFPAPRGWSPDGRRFAFSTAPAELDETTLSTFSIASFGDAGVTVGPAFGEGRVLGRVWRWRGASDGWLVNYGNPEASVDQVTLEGLEPTLDRIYGSPSCDLRSVNATSGQALARCPEGDEIALWWISAGEAPRSILRVAEGDFRRSAFSPTGRHLLVGLEIGDEVHVVHEVARDGVRRVHAEAKLASGQPWADDGKAYVVRDAQGLVVHRVDGGPATRLAGSSFRGWAPGR